MKLNMTQIGDEELLAYVDGQLDAAACELIEEHLKNNAEDREKVAEWQSQSSAIQALFAPAGHEPVPDRLNPHNLASPPSAANQNLWQFNSWRSAAAAIMLVAFGASIGWVGRDYNAQNQGVSQGLVTAAVSAHQLFTTQPVHAVEVPMDEASHLTSWLSTTLDRRLEMPDLTSKGYQLLGGRILPATTDAAAQIMYTAEDGKRITLYLTPRNDSHSNANLFAEVNGLDALYWANDAVTCTIVGDLSRAEMEDIASEVFAALNWQKQPYRRI